MEHWPADANLSGSDRLDPYLVMISEARNHLEGNIDPLHSYTGCIFLHDGQQCRAILVPETAHETVVEEQLVAKPPYS